MKMMAARDHRKSVFSFLHFLLQFHLLLLRILLLLLMLLPSFPPFFFFSTFFSFLSSSSLSSPPSLASFYFFRLFLHLVLLLPGLFFTLLFLFLFFLFSFFSFSTSSSYLSSSSSSILILQSTYSSSPPPPPPSTSSPSTSSSSSSSPSSSSLCFLNFRRAGFSSFSLLRRILHRRLGVQCPTLIVVHLLTLLVCSRKRIVRRAESFPFTKEDILLTGEPKAAGDNAISVGFAVVSKPVGSAKSVSIPKAKLTTIVRASSTKIGEGLGHRVTGVFEKQDSLAPTSRATTAPSSSPNIGMIIAIVVGIVVVVLILGVFVWYCRYGTQ